MLESTADGDGLARSLARSGAVLAQSPFGIAVIDEAGHFVSVNDAFCEVCGYRPDELIGTGFACVFAPADRAAALAQHHAFMRDGTRQNGEWRVWKHDGSLLVVLVESVRLNGGEGASSHVVYMVDITERSRAEAALRASEDTFRALFETLPTGVIYHDPAGFVTTANPSALCILGLTLEELRAHAPDHTSWQVVHEDGRPFTADDFPVTRVLRTGCSVQGVLMGVRLPRGRVWLRVNAVPVLRDGRIHQIYTSLEDVSGNVEMAAELRVQAETDFLTGALNRRSFMDALSAQFDRQHRHGAHPTGVLIVDVDHFKLVNDSHGHAVGDAVLRHVTHLMRTAIRRVDQLGRYGGEEFAVLLPDTDGPASELLAHRLCDLVAESPLDCDPRPVNITVSVGVSVLEPVDHVAEAVLLRADEALYQAKRSGRNCVRTLLR